MYEWLVRPQYIKDISVGIDIIAGIFIVLFLFNEIFIIRCLSNINARLLVISFIFILYFTIMQFLDFSYGLNIVTAITRTLLNVIVIFVLMIYVNFIAKKKNNSIFFIRPVFLSTGIFILINFFVLIFDKAAVYSEISGRMYGTLEHPNFFGVTTALIFLTTIYYIQVNIRELNNFGVIFSFIILFICFALVVYSGSRTSLLLIGSGLFWMFLVSKVNLKGKIVTITIPIVLLTLASLYLNDSNDVRILSSQNTREEAWGYLLTTFINNPFLGIGLSNMQFSESSYMRPLAAYGMIGSFLYFVIILSSIVFMFLFFYNKRKIKFDISFVLLGILFGGVTEGFLIETISFPSIMYKYILMYMFIFKVDNSYE
jgi:hypothetical protein